jgi:CheY-like chemotaxis protein
MTAIVVVDDRASNRQIVGKLASSIADDAQVVTFADPLAALAHIEGRTPDILITDFKMSPIDGDELIRRFRSVPACAEVPTVVITAFQDVGFRDRALQAGSTAFLPSPIDHEEFRNCLRGLLAIRRGRISLHDEARALGGDGEPLGRLSTDATEMVAAMLQDVNLHLVATLAELRLLRGDFDTMVAETQVAAIFVDNSMKVRGFTPAILALFGSRVKGLISPLAAVAAKLNYHDMATDFERMLKSKKPLQRYLETADGTHYVLKMLPSLDNRSIVGAAITLTKIAA